jgi:hypothetical protein
VASALVIAVVTAAGAQLRTLREKLPPGKGCVISTAASVLWGPA